MATPKPAAKSKSAKPAAAPASTDAAQAAGHANSRPNRIAALDVGQSVAEATRFAFDAATKEDIKACLTNLRGTMTKAAHLATQRSGHEFTTDTFTSLTYSGDIMVVGVVTRIS